MKNVNFRRSLVGLVGLYLVFLTGVLSSAFGEEPGKTKHTCYRDWATGSIGIWCCPPNTFDCYHNDNCKNYVSESTCYTVNPI